MFTMEALRKKIRSAKDLNGIVRTMKTLAAVNIRNYQKAVESISQYFHTIELGFAAVLQNGQVGVRNNARSQNDKTAVVIFGSDQGLCGGFNDRIVEHAMKWMYKTEASKRQKLVLCIGQRAGGILEREGHPLEGLYPVPGSLSGASPVVQQILLDLDRLRSEEEVERIVIFNNRLISSASYAEDMVQLLPLDEQWYNEMRSRKWESRSLPTFSMSSDRLISVLVSQYIFVSLYRGSVESMASENAGRLASMQAADKNIEEALGELQTSFRNVRQDSITSEILDIVSGYEVLSSNTI